jgi:hypothetical protein
VSTWHEGHGGYGDGIKSRFLLRFSCSSLPIIILILLLSFLLQLIHLRLLFLYCFCNLFSQLKGRTQTEAVSADGAEGNILTNMMMIKMKSKRIRWAKHITRVWKIELFTKLHSLSY